ncbi:hypothetical protein ABZY58_11610 [Micromonospora tulbaghiae]|uniref:hypothetical protein n=1 Tax=Micromonospora tulbaghiae TaxID=479978 RepID=UPI0033B77F3F
MSAVDDLRFWMQTFEDARRTILCPPHLADQVRSVIDQHGVAGMYDVQESTACPQGAILLVDDNAVDAGTRQALQQAANAPPLNRNHQHGMDCCRDCFDGLHVHPEHPGDPACAARAGADARCIYAKEAR